MKKMILVSFCTLLMGVGMAFPAASSAREEIKVLDVCCYDLDGGGQPDVEKTPLHVRGFPFLCWGVRQALVKKILLVEDEPILRKHLARFLRRKGHTVVCTTDSDEAFPLLKGGSVDLLITDLVLPSGKGFALVEEGKKRGLKVAVITAYGSQAVQEKLLRLGVFGYLEKPFDLEVFHALVEKGFGDYACSAIGGG